MNLAVMVTTWCAFTSTMHDTLPGHPCSCNTSSSYCLSCRWSRKGARVCQPHTITGLTGAFIHGHAPRGRNQELGSQCANQPWPCSECFESHCGSGVSKPPLDLINATSTCTCRWPCEAWSTRPSFVPSTGRPPGASTRLGYRRALLVVPGKDPLIRPTWLYEYWSLRLVWRPWGGLELITLLFPLL